MFKSQIKHYFIFLTHLVKSPGVGGEFSGNRFLSKCISYILAIWAFLFTMTTKASATSTASQTFWAYISHPIVLTDASPWRRSPCTQISSYSAHRWMPRRTHCTEISLYRACRRLSLHTPYTCSSAIHARRSAVLAYRSHAAMLADACPFTLHTPGSHHPVMLLFPYLSIPDGYLFFRFKIFSSLDPLRLLHGLTSPRDDFLDWPAISTANKHTAQ